LDDGFIAVCTSFLYGQVKRFDYDLNEVWSLDLKYPTANDTHGNVAFVDVVRVGDALYVAGHTVVAGSRPFAAKIDFDGNVLWESGLLESKGSIHQALGIYARGDDVMLLTTYYSDGTKPWIFEWVIVD